MTVKETSGKINTYTYNTNAKLSQLLTKTTNGVVTKYIYGLGLIGEEKQGYYRVYHYDLRGSTVAITDTNGTVTDTFKYDTYGKLVSRTGSTFVIFGYNGRDGVITDKNGLIYMRSRYYSPQLKRFVNADVLHGEISDSTSLNRYSYVNGNPISCVDPFGLSKDERWETTDKSYIPIKESEPSSYGISWSDLPGIFATAADGFEMSYRNIKFVKNGKYINIKGDLSALQELGITQRRIKIDNINKFTQIAEYVDPGTVFKTNFMQSFDTPSLVLDTLSIGIDTVYEMSQYEDVEDKAIVGTYAAATGIFSTVATSAASAGATALVTKIGLSVGTAIAPGVGTLIGLGAGLLVGWALDSIFDWVQDEYIDDIVENN